MRVKGLDVFMGDILGYKEKVTIIGVDGRSGSGKSTLAKLLRTTLIDHGLQCSVISLDAFWVKGRLYRRVLEAYNKKPVESFPFDYEYNWRLFREVFLSRLWEERKKRGPAERSFEFMADSLDAKSHVFIVEGCTALRCELRSYYDLALYTELVGHDSLQNAIHRDGSISADYYKNTWRDIENRYLEEHRPEYYADYIARSYLREGYVITRCNSK